MADVQLENGYTRIANELLEAFGMFNFNTGQYTMLWLLLRLSYGCGKKTATLRNWADASVVGIERQKCKPILKQLEKDLVIGVDWQTKTIGINKDYDNWLVSKKEIVDPKRFQDLILYNVKCNSTVTFVTPQLHQNSTKCNSTVTQMSLQSYINVTPQLHDPLVEPHHDLPETPPKDNKEIKKEDLLDYPIDNYIIKQGICRSSDLAAERKPKGSLKGVDRGLIDELKEVYVEYGYGVFAFESDLTKYGYEFMERCMSAFMDEIDRDKKIDNTAAYLAAIVKRRWKDGQNG